MTTPNTRRVPLVIHGVTRDLNTVVFLLVPLRASPSGRSSVEAGQEASPSDTIVRGDDTSQVGVPVLCVMLAISGWGALRRLSWPNIGDDFVGTDGTRP